LEGHAHMRRLVDLTVDDVEAFAKPMRGILDGAPSPSIQDTGSPQVVERRKKRPGPRPVPGNSEQRRGWSSLVGEIGNSSKRVLCARGGFFTVETVQSDGVVVRDRVVAPSYRCDPERVTDNDLADFWHYACDPQRKKDSVPQALPKVPRLTVTKREVDPLPAVPGILAQQQRKKAQEERAIRQQEKITHPTLAEMMISMFGDMPKTALTSLQLRYPDEPLADLIEDARKYGDDPAPEKIGVLQQGRRDASHGSSIRRNCEEVLHPDDTGRRAHRPLDRPSRQAPEIAINIRKMQDTDRFGVIAPADESGKHLEMQKIVEGQLLDKWNQGQPETRRAFVGAMILRVNQATTPDGMSEELKHANQLEVVFQNSPKMAVDHWAGELLASAEACRQRGKSVGNRAGAKVRRLATRFQRNKALLSRQLEFHVLRVQQDRLETCAAKMDNLIPSVVAGGRPQSPQEPRREPSGQFLMRARRHAEGQRRQQHRLLVDQVDVFTTFLRKTADASRAPTKGEIFLSGCFCHVLAGGCVVDSVYFFRVLHKLPGDEFCEACVVNLLAACCMAFSIAIPEYKAHVVGRGLPLLSPRQASYEAMQDESRGRDMVALGAWDDTDPCPFVPVTPGGASTPGSLSTVEDPLFDTLAGTQLDAPLARYDLDQQRLVHALVSASARDAAEAPSRTMSYADSVSSDGASAASAVVGRAKSRGSVTIDPGLSTQGLLVEAAKAKGRHAQRQTISVLVKPQQPAKDRKPVAKVAEKGAGGLAAIVE